MISKMYVISILIFVSMTIGAKASVNDSILTYNTASDYFLKLNETVEVNHTPIPSYVNGLDEFTMSLNGEWLFNENPKEGFENMPNEIKTWDKITVPSEWYMNSYNVKKGNWAGFSKEFFLPKKWKDKNIIIRFGSVQSECKIFLNGRYVGRHVGSMTQFEKDLTSFIKDGKNILSMYVKSESASENLSKISHYAKHQVGGILRSVDLIALPNNYIKAFNCNVILNDSLNKGLLYYNINLSKKINAELQISISEIGVEGLNICANKVVYKEKISKFSGLAIVDNPILWHAEYPFLYSLELSLYINNIKVETIRKKIGFKKIDICGNSLYVNGKQIKLRGVSRHDVSAYDGRAIRDTALLRKDIEQLRNANCNYIRTSHYTPDEYMLDLCDRYGIFIEDEAPVCWDYNEDTKENAKLLFYSFKSMIYRDMSHPSVLLWSIANESRWNSRFIPCLMLARSVTPEIPVKFSHSEYFGIIKDTDIGTRHYPGWQGLMKYDNYFRPILFGEALHINCYNTSENITDPGLRDLWGDYIKYFIDNMQDSPAIAGLGIWSAIDEMYYPKNNEPCGYGPWGIVDGFRREKPEFWHMKMSYSPIVVTAKHFQQIGGELVIPIESRYNYVSTENLDFIWEDGNVKGISNINLKPNEQGTLLIPHIMKGDTLSLSIRDKRGFMISKWNIPRSYKPHYSMPKLNKKGLVSVYKSDSLYIIRTNKIDLHFSRIEGCIKSLKKENKEVFYGGVKMYIIPLLKEYEVVDFIPQESNNKDSFRFFSDCLSDWHLLSENLEMKDNIVIIKVKGKYGKLPILYEYKIDCDGRIRIDYVINIKEITFPIRQIGIGFDIPKDYDSFIWRRKALWTFYPNDHIGRPCGVAKAFYKETLSDYLKKHIVPNHPYSFDGNIYGSNDFRSTKHNIISLKYKNGNDILFEIESNGKQHVRSWVNFDRISFIVANYSNGGNEHYLSFDSDRTKYQSVLKDDGGDFAGWIQLNIGEY